jgi:NADPH-dependent 2,4-dienoyl-CoA reductase/sulfur reductase-like enzyme
MRVQLIGDNARYLARHWYECRLVDTSDGTDGVDFYPKPNSPGADALYDSYLMRLRAEAKAVGVVLTLDDNTRLQ